MRYKSEYRKWCMLDWEKENAGYYMQKAEAIEKENLDQRVIDVGNRCVEIILKTYIYLCQRN